MVTVKELNSYSYENAASGISPAAFFCKFYSETADEVYATPRKHCFCGFLFYPDPAAPEPEFFT